MLPVRSITGHLFFYAFVLVVPILLVSAFIGLAYLRHEDIRVDSLAQAQVAAVSSEIGNRLDTVEATLKVLAVDPSVVFGNVDELRKRVTLIALPAGAWFVLRDPSGKQLLNTNLPVGAALPTFAAEGDDLIFKEGRTWYANVLWGPVGKTFITGIAVPIRSPPIDGEIVSSLSVVIPVSYFQSIFDRVPRGWIVTINDRAGKIIARSLDRDERVGKPMSPTGWEETRRLPGGQGGLWHNVYSLEGERVRGAYYRMPNTGWLVSVSALPEIYDAPKQSILRLGAALAALCLVATTVLAFLMGNRITHALQVLQIKAAAMKDMRLIDIPRTSLKEVNAVAKIMQETVQVLRVREQQQSILIQELNHRVKNTLATVQSIGRMTLKNSKDLPAFEQTFSSRLVALSVTHDLLTASSWAGVELYELLATELKPFFVGSQISIQGPQVKLTSKVAIALGMAVHEMGTNAAKYGALHGEHGSIAIRWMVVEDRLVIDWREKSGRAIEQPKHKGFGTQLIQQTIRNELEGTLSLKYESDGLHAVFTIPLSSQPTV